MPTRCPTSADQVLKLCALNVAARASHQHSTGPRVGIGHPATAWLGQILEELFQASLGCFVSFDLAWPAAGGGVVDELLLDLEART